MPGNGEESQASDEDEEMSGSESNDLRLREESGVSSGVDAKADNFALMLTVTRVVIE
jgi:hypothetical protein